MHIFQVQAGMPMMRGRLEEGRITAEMPFIPGQELVFDDEQMLIDDIRRHNSTIQGHQLPELCKDVPPGYTLFDLYGVVKGAQIGDVARIHNRHVKVL